MKLDKIKFAQLVGFISYRYSLTITQDDMREMDELIDIEAEQVRVYASPLHIDDLMRLMVQGNNKLEAIKVHRAITGYGLKESKDAVEKYWPVERKDAWTKEQLLNKLNNPPRPHLDKSIIEAFIKDL